MGIVHPKKWSRLFIRKLRNFILYYCLPDKTYLKLKYYQVFKKKLNLNNPQTYNEKLQWLKLYDRNPEYHNLVDKYFVKGYVSELIGDQYVIKTFGVYDQFEDIDFDILPEKFVLKCTHDSSSIVICADKSKFDFKFAKCKITDALKVDYYHNENRQWAYKGIKPRIIAEEYLVDEHEGELKDYKFFCFQGRCKAFFIATDRPYDTKFDFYDLELNLLPFTNGHPNSNKPFHKPKNYEVMLSLAESLSYGIPHVRVDFYNIDGRIYFGEMTLYHWGGMMPFEPMEWDYKFGSWITLPNRG